MKNSILIFLLILMQYSCNSDDTVPEMMPVLNTVIATDNLFGNGEEGIAAQHMIISNDSVWRNLIARMDAFQNTSNRFSEINIDFSKYTIIAIFDTVKTSAGYQLDTNITSNSNEISVNVITSTPGDNSATVITQPFHIIKIPVTTLPIVFN